MKSYLYKNMSKMYLIKILGNQMGLFELFDYTDLDIMNEVFIVLLI
jgi:hypothetical protein